MHYLTCIISLDKINLAININTIESDLNQPVAVYRRPILILVSTLKFGQVFTSVFLDNSGLDLQLVEQNIIFLTNHST